MSVSSLSQAITTTIIVGCLAGCATMTVPVADVSPQAVAPIAIMHIFKDRIEPARYELPAAALATWRQFAKQKPTLLLYAYHPLLKPIPAESREAVRQLVVGAPIADLVRRSTIEAADTLFDSTMTVSAAIDAGLIGELVYVLSPYEGKASTTLGEFQQRTFSAGFLTEEEAAALTMRDGAIRGTVRGIPLRCVTPEQLPPISAPLLIHIDLGHFKDQYINDIKTPLYELLLQLATNLSAADYKALAVTLSYSNQEGNISLESRFLINDLADLIRDPGIAATALPPNWAMRSNAFLLRALYSASESRKLIVQAAESHPDDPAALYMLALHQLEQLQIDEALVTLDRTVALDAGYALAYLEMVERSHLLNLNEDQILMLLGKATKAFPDNPFLPMRIAALLIESGRGREALPQLRTMQQLAWSPQYHSDVPALLARMIKAAETH